MVSDEQSSSGRRAQLRVSGLSVLTISLLATSGELLVSGQVYHFRLAVFLPLFGLWLGRALGRDALAPLLISAPIIIPIWGWRHLGAPGLFEARAEWTALSVGTGVEVWLLTLITTAIGSGALAPRRFEAPSIARLAALLFFLSALTVDVGLSVHSPFPTGPASIDTSSSVNWHQLRVGLYPYAALPLAAFCLTLFRIERLGVVLLLISSVLIVLFVFGGYFASADVSPLVGLFSPHFDAWFGWPANVWRSAGASLAAAFAGEAIRVVWRARTTIQTSLHLRTSLVGAAISLFAVPFLVGSAFALVWAGVNIFGGKSYIPYVGLEFEDYFLVAGLAFALGASVSRWPEAVAVVVVLGAAGIEAALAATSVLNGAITQGQLPTYGALIVVALVYAFAAKRWVRDRDQLPTPN